MARILRKVVSATQREQIAALTISNLLTVAIIALVGVGAGVVVAVVVFLSRITWPNGPSLHDLVPYALIVVATAVLVSIRLTFPRQMTQQNRIERGALGNAPMPSIIEESFDQLSLYGHLISIQLQGIAKEEPFIAFDIMLTNASGIDFDATLKGLVRIAGNDCNASPTLMGPTPVRLGNGRAVISVRQAIGKNLATKCYWTLQPADGVIECNLGSLNLELISLSTGKTYLSRGILDDRFYIRGPLNLDLENWPVPETFIFPTTVAGSYFYTDKGIPKTESELNQK